MNTLDYLISLGISEDNARDFIDLRKKKKGVISESSMKRLKKQADILGMTLDQAVAECVDRSWATIKADWIIKPAAKTQSDRMREMAPGIAERDIKTIDMFEVIDVTQRLGR